MITFNGGVRTLIIWLTLFFLFSTLIINQYGSLIMAYLISHSDLYSWTLALQSVQSDMIPAGVITVLFTLCILSAGSLLATAFIFVMHVIVNILTTMNALFNRDDKYKHQKQACTQRVLNINTPQ